LTFTGRSVVVYDLTPGKRYTFTLSSEEELYLAGVTSAEYVASKILYAQDLTITACGSGRLTVQWQPPEDGNVQQWRVRCYNEAGYDKTIITTDLLYTFTDLDHSTACSVEVTAEGMPQGVTTSISANPVTIMDLRCTFTEDMALLVQWLPLSQLPVSQWVLRCRLESGEELVLRTSENHALLLAVPGQVYDFTIETADGNFVFNHSHQYTAENVPLFNSFGLSYTDLNTQLYLLPDGDKWTASDFPEDGSTDHLFLGQRGALVVTSGISPEVSENPVRIQFVFHSASGELLGISEMTMEWNKMWSDGLGILPLPQLLDVESQYILTVYLDGMYALREDFTLLPSPLVEDPQIQEPAI
jgi:hypothetical protein